MGFEYDSSVYGIVFNDYWTYKDGSTGCPPPNPDIAGIGVVLAFALTALLTTVASIAAAFLDAAVMDEKAFLPVRIQRWMNRGLSQSALEQRRLWRRLLDRLILGLADQQLVTGFALLICGYLSAFPVDPTGDAAHWTLLVYMACLSSSTHLASVLILRKYFDEHKSTGVLRVIFIVLFSLFLIPSIIMSYCFNVFFIPVLLVAVIEVDKGRSNVLVTGIWYTFQITAYVYLFYAAVMQLMTKHHARIKRWKIWSVLRSLSGLNILSSIFSFILPTKLYEWFGRLLASAFWYLAFLGPGTVFVLQIFFSMTALVFTLAQKFAKPRPGLDEGKCSLNTTDENQLGFGQLLAIIFLSLPLLAAWETYIEERIKHLKYSQSNQTGNGTYMAVASDASLLNMTPMQQSNNGSSYFQYSPAPSMSNWRPMQEHAFPSPPTAYYGNTEYTGLFASPPAV